MAGYRRETKEVEIPAFAGMTKARLSEILQESVLCIFMHV